MMREHAIYKDYIRYIGDGFNFSELYSYEDGKELHFNKFMDYWEDSKTGILSFFQAFLHCFCLLFQDFF